MVKDEVDPKVSEGNPFTPKPGRSSGKFINVGRWRRPPADSPNACPAGGFKFVAETNRRCAWGKGGRVLQDSWIVTHTWELPQFLDCYGKEPSVLHNLLLRPAVD